MDKIPEGYCQCGCGQRTTVLTINNASKGLVKGTSRKYIDHHFAKSEKFRAMYEPAEKRFWSKVKKGKSNDCWLWTGGTNKGYGIFNLDHHSMFAHRAAWILTHGALESSVDVCHNCPDGDNRLCVNPAHMFLGTRSENSKDTWKKGRGIPPGPTNNSGENSHKAKMTDAKVIELRRRYANGETIKELMTFSGVNYTSTWKAAKRITWKHLP